MQTYVDAVAMCLSLHKPTIHVGWMKGREVNESEREREKEQRRKITWRRLEITNYIL